MTRGAHDTNRRPIDEGRLNEQPRPPQPDDPAGYPGDEPPVEPETSDVVQIDDDADIPETLKNDIFPTGINRPMEGNEIGPDDVAPDPLAPDRDIGRLGPL